MESNKGKCKVSKTCGTKKKNSTSSPKHYASPLKKHFILTQNLRGENCNISQILHIFATCQTSKSVWLLKVTVVYLQYRRAQVMDEELLSQPPTLYQPMFLYWANTNRMGTAKHDLCNSFYVVKMCFLYIYKKSNKFIHVDSLSDS